MLVSICSMAAPIQASATSSSTSGVFSEIAYHHSDPLFSQWPIIPSLLYLKSGISPLITLLLQVRSVGQWRVSPTFLCLILSAVSPLTTESLSEKKCRAAMLLAVFDGACRRVPVWQKLTWLCEHFEQVFVL